MKHEIGLGLKNRCRINGQLVSLEELLHRCSFEQILKGMSASNERAFLKTVADLAEKQVTEEELILEYLANGCSGCDLNVEI